MSQIKGKQHFMELNKTLFVKLWWVWTWQAWERDYYWWVAENVNDMSATTKSLKGSLDRQEQYSKRNLLLIHGLLKSRKDNKDELVIDTIKEKIGKEIKKDEIDRSHRLGAPKNNGKNIPIFM